MIKVTPEPEWDKIQNVCANSSVIPEENALCYFIYDNCPRGGEELLVGFCLFKLTASGGRIIRLRNTKDAADREALIIAGRACLDFIERTGGDDAVFEEDDKALADCLGFTEREGKLLLNLCGYFDTCKKYEGEPV